MLIVKVHNVDAVNIARCIDVVTLQVGRDDVGGPQLTKCSRNFATLLHQKEFSSPAFAPSPLSS